MITVNDNTIEITASYFFGHGQGITAYQKDLLSDMFGTIYNNQKIIVNAFDGENIERSGFLDYLLWACQEFNIPFESVTIITPNATLTSKFNISIVPLTIFYSAKTYLGGSFQRNIDAKFVGVSIGKFNPNRFRLIYELDSAFPNDNFLIFHPSPTLVKQFYNNINGIYTKELSWLESKKFDVDLIYSDTLNTNAVNWQDSYSSYHNIWDKFDIEIIAETDTNTNYWFTEKTGRCLATGKPFLLLAGTGSLKTLQDFGFKTFNEVLDESYDNEKSSIHRINKIILSLMKLYQSFDRNNKINRMYEIAQHNITLYNKKYVHT